MSYKNRMLALLATTVLAGCTAVGPDYVRPTTDALPDAWQQNGPAASAQHMSAWWEQLSDPKLNALIAQADEGSLDLKIALARMKAARAAVGVAGADYAPGVDAVGSSVRQKTSHEISSSVPAPQQRVDWFDTVGAQASWELDFFGRVSRSVEAASAGYQATQEETRAVRVALYADVATTYVQLRTLQARLSYAHKNARAQRKTRNLVKNKFEAELISELDYRQAQRNLAITMSVIPQLETDIDAALYRLAVLVGKPPGALDAQLRPPAPIPNLPKEIVGVMPRDLVRQRPDIRQAERNLAAATAEIGVAKADLYPRLFLDGNFAFTAASGSLLTYNAQGWSFGPGFSWNIFSGGRVQSNIDIQEAEVEAARAAYENTVLGALAEVESSLSGYIHEGRRLAHLNESVMASRKSVQLVTAAYDAGLADFQNVLDAQRTLFEQQDSAAASQGLRVTRFIAVTRAMGGGWTGPAMDASGVEVADDNGQPGWVQAHDRARL